VPSTLPDGDETTDAAPTSDAQARPGTVDPGAGPHPVARRRLVWLLVLLALGVLVVDQLTKQWALSALDGDRRALVGDLLGLQLVMNPGAALSTATGMTWVLTVVAVVVVVVLVRIARRLGSTTWTVALGLLLGGALGNLTDRLLREPGFARGEVVDFIAYVDWFVGNVADIAIVVAAVLVVLLVARGVQVDGTRVEPAHETVAATSDEPSDGPSDVAAAGSVDETCVRPVDGTDAPRG